MKYIIIILIEKIHSKTYETSGNYFLKNTIFSIPKVAETIRQTIEIKVIDIFFSLLSKIAATELVINSKRNSSKFAVNPYKSEMTSPG